MTDSVSVVLLSVPLFNKLIDGDEVLKPHVELFDTVVRFALLRQVLHKLLSGIFTCLSGGHARFEANSKR